VVDTSRLTRNAPLRRFQDEHRRFLDAQDVACTDLDDT
jgi:hypothetical protein